MKKIENHQDLVNASEQLHSWISGLSSLKETQDPVTHAVNNSSLRSQANALWHQIEDYLYPRFDVKVDEAEYVGGFPTSVAVIKKFRIEHEFTKKILAMKEGDYLDSTGYDPAIVNRLRGYAERIVNEYEGALWHVIAWAKVYQTGLRFTNVIQHGYPRFDAEPMVTVYVEGEWTTMPVRIQCQVCEKVVIVPRAEGQEAQGNPEELWSLLSGGRFCKSVMVCGKNKCRVAGGQMTPEAMAEEGFKIGDYLTVFFPKLERLPKEIVDADGWPRYPLELMNLSMW